MTALHEESAIEAKNWLGIFLGIQPVGSTIQYKNRVQYAWAPALASFPVTRMSSWLGQPQHQMHPASALSTRCKHQTARWLVSMQIIDYWYDYLQRHAARSTRKLSSAEHIYHTHLGMARGKVGKLHAATILETHMNSKLVPSMPMETNHRRELFILRRTA